MNLINKIFSESLLNWYDLHGRKDLPWQQPYTDYRIWISEIMLQQTQVKTVIPYFLKFMERFKTIEDLASATTDEVLALWSGLGYYSRARNLHKTAQQIVEQFSGRFPQDLISLQSLPGIGPSTAAAIASLAYNQPTAILDGNVKRVLSRYFLIKQTQQQQQSIETQLWQQAQSCMPSYSCREYTQAIMDMGATCCTLKNPQCQNCPLQTHCLAHQQKVVQDYPPKKPKKHRPIREELFLLLYTQDNYIYLEQRPAKGIWGGLWCFPSLDLNECPLTYLKQTYNLTIPTEPKTLMNIKHSFTHFHLHITAKTLQTPIEPTMPGRWFLVNEVHKVGLAKPMREIIDYYSTAMPMDLT